jgi:hypothetical protein
MGPRAPGEPASDLNDEVALRGAGAAALPLQARVEALRRELDEARQLEEALRGGRAGGAGGAARAASGPAATAVAAAAEEGKLLRAVFFDTTGRTERSPRSPGADFVRENRLRVSSGSAAAPSQTLAVVAAHTGANAGVLRSPPRNARLEEEAAQVLAGRLDVLDGKWAYRGMAAAGRRGKRPRPGARPRGAESRPAREPRTPGSAGAAAAPKPKPLASTASVELLIKELEQHDRELDASAGREVRRVQKRFAARMHLPAPMVSARGAARATGPATAAADSPARSLAALPGLWLGPLELFVSRTLLAASVARWRAHCGEAAARECYWEASAASVRRVQACFRGKRGRTVAARARAERAARRAAAATRLQAAWRGALARRQVRAALAARLRAAREAAGLRLQCVWRSHRARRRAWTVARTELWSRCLHDWVGAVAVDRAIALLRRGLQSAATIPGDADAELQQAKRAAPLPGGSSGRRPPLAQTPAAHRRAVLCALERMTASKARVPRPGPMRMPAAGRAGTVLALLCASREAVLATSAEIDGALAADPPAPAGAGAGLSASCARVSKAEAPALAAAEARRKRERAARELASAQTAAREAESAESAERHELLLRQARALEAVQAGRREAERRKALQRADCERRRALALAEADAARAAAQADSARDLASTQRSLRARAEQQELVARSELAERVDAARADSALRRAELTRALRRTTEELARALTQKEEQQRCELLRLDTFNATAQERRARARSAELAAALAVRRQKELREQLLGVEQQQEKLASAFVLDALGAAVRRTCQWRRRRALEDELAAELAALQGGFLAARLQLDMTSSKMRAAEEAFQSELVHLPTLQSQVEAQLERECQAKIALTVRTLEAELARAGELHSAAAAVLEARHHEALSKLVSSPSTASST